MSLNRGFVLIEVSLCIVITLVVVTCVLGIKKLEVVHSESIETYLEQEDQRYIQILINRNECEIECLNTNEEVPPSNTSSDLS
ncbi:hypothetical protein [Anaerorhabdus sp.]|uniref:hypothetical protein n=1 Tax=Anaerorhabdus sp. TaxID=1872524 RepID=UPI002FCC823D